MRGVKKGCVKKGCVQIIGVKKVRVKTMYDRYSPG